MSYIPDVVLACALIGVAVLVIAVIMHRGWR